MEILSLKVIGYYGHYNFGDEQYKLSFKKLFNDYLVVKYTLDFIDCDKIVNENFKKNDVIILGGGDILNDYFLDTINEKFKDLDNKIIAISVGLPFVNIFFTNKLNIIDYIFIRTTQDLNILKRYYGNNVGYLPDLSFVLSGDKVSRVSMVSSMVSSKVSSRVSRVQRIERESNIYLEYKNQNKNQNDDHIKQFIAKIKNHKNNKKKIIGIC